MFGSDDAALASRVSYGRKTGQKLGRGDANAGADAEGGQQGRLNLRRQLPSRAQPSMTSATTRIIAESPSMPIRCVFLKKNYISFTLSNNMKRSVYLRTPHIIHC